MTLTPRDWFQEAKIYKQSYNAVLALLNKEQVDHSITKDREQRLKAVVEDTINEPELWRDQKNGLEVVIRCLRDVLSTLYTDIPAPKEDK